MGELVGKGESERAKQRSQKKVNVSNKICQGPPRWLIGPGRFAAGKTTHVSERQGRCTGLKILSCVLSFSHKYVRQGEGPADCDLCVLFFRNQRDKKRPLHLEEPKRRSRNTANSYPPARATSTVSVTPASSAAAFASASAALAFVADTASVVTPVQLKEFKGGKEERRWF